MWKFHQQCNYLCTTILWWEQLVEKFDICGHPRDYVQKVWQPRYKCVLRACYVDRRFKCITCIMTDTITPV